MGKNQHGRDREKGSLLLQGTAGNVCREVALLWDVPSFLSLECLTPVLQ